MDKSVIFGENDKSSIQNKSMNEVRESAIFGNDLEKDKSIKQDLTPRADETGRLTPRADETGRSDESDEGIVADHRPFNGIK